MVRDLAPEKEWRIRFEEHKKSGLSIKAWCAKNGFKIQGNNISLMKCTGR